MGNYMIIVNNEWCKGCEICIDCCPLQLLIKSDETNKKGVHIPKLKNEGQCNGCQLCELNCPDMAIFYISDESNSFSSGE